MHQKPAAVPDCLTARTAYVDRLQPLLTQQPAIRAHVTPVHACICYPPALSCYSGTSLHMLSSGTVHCCWCRADIAVDCGAAGQRAGAGAALGGGVEQAGAALGPVCCGRARSLASMLVRKTLLPCAREKDTADLCSFNCCRTTRPRNWQRFARKLPRRCAMHALAYVPTCDLYVRF